jgi:HEAT repeat protein
MLSSRLTTACRRRRIAPCCLSLLRCPARLTQSVSLTKAVRRYRKPALVTVAIVGCLFIAFALGKRSSGPSYQGKPLTEWLTDRRRWTPGEEVALSDASTRAVQAIGTNALPLLLKMLRSSDSQLKMQLAARVQRYRFFFNLIPMNGPRQEAARLGLHALGPIARPAFPELVEMILSSDQDGGALYVLYEAADSDTIAALTNGLASPDYRVRQRTVFALSALRQAPEVSLPALVRALKDPIPSVKNQAVQSLRAYGATAQAVAPLLNDLSRDPDPAISSFATEALRNIATSTTSKQQ